MNDKKVACTLEKEAILQGRWRRGQGSPRAPNPWQVFHKERIRGWRKETSGLGIT
jgi:hypothetical protein